MPLVTPLITDACLSARRPNKGQLDNLTFTPFNMLPAWLGYCLGAFLDTSESPDFRISAQLQVRGACAASESRWDLDEMALSQSFEPCELNVHAYSLRSRSYVSTLCIYGLMITWHLFSYLLINTKGTFPSKFLGVYILKYRSSRQILFYLVGT